MINTIIFDFGDVLWTNADTIFFEVLARYGISAEESLEIRERHRPKLKIGQERIDKIWETVREYTTSDVEQISSEYNDLIAIDIEMIELCKILKQKGYKLGILANESYDWMNIKKKRYDLDKIFDIVYSSADIKVAKPEKESYLKIIENLHARPEETLFIDNLSRNTQAAEALGIKSLLFTDSDQLQKDLAKMNIV